MTSFATAPIGKGSNGAKKGKLSYNFPSAQATDPTAPMANASNG
jgi:hypothetical protein